MIMLNTRCSKFNLIHSLDLWEGKRFRFPDLTQLFKGKPWEKECQGSGFLSGKLEAWKLIILLTIILFSINEDLCPFEKK